MTRHRFLAMLIPFATSGRIGVTRPTSASTHPHDAGPQSRHRLGRDSGQTSESFWSEPGTGVRLPANVAVVVKRRRTAEGAAVAHRDDATRIGQLRG